METCIICDTQFEVIFDDEDITAEFCPACGEALGDPYSNRSQLENDDWYDE